MSATRILSVAAVAAFASISAQAGDLYGADFQSQFKPSRDRAEVRAEAVQALPNFKNYLPEQQVAAPSASRDTVRAEAITAARAGAIATGNRS